MKSHLIRWLGVLLILETGLLHIMTAQLEYEEAAYMGYLFLANFLGALIAALGIYRKQTWGWVLGLVIAIGSIAGYAWSRTLGMPGMEVEEWFTPYGAVALSIEGAFVILFLLRPWKMHGDASHIINPQLQNGLMIAGVFWLVAIGALAYQWDESVRQAYGMHVVSLEQTLEAPELSFAQFEDEYGVQISLAASSMMGSIIDVRLKIIDPDKAHALLKNQAALLVGEQELILAPHLHSHNGGRLQAGRIYIMFFPSEQIIFPGSKISLVFGSVRVEPVIVK